ncbi:hypothetical protein QTP88_013950 [Uroleucon formosanum]
MEDDFKSLGPWLTVHAVDRIVVEASRRYIQYDTCRLILYLFRKRTFPEQNKKHNNMTSVCVTFVCTVARAQAHIQQGSAAADDAAAAPCLVPTSANVDVCQRRRRHRYHRSALPIVAHTGNRGMSVCASVCSHRSTPPTLPHVLSQHSVRSSHSVFRCVCVAAAVCVSDHRRRRSGASSAITFDSVTAPPPPPLPPTPTPPPLPLPPPPSPSPSPLAARQYYYYYYATTAAAVAHSHSCSVRAPVSDRCLIRFRECFRSMRDFHRASNDPYRCIPVDAVVIDVVPPRRMPSSTRPLRPPVIFVVRSSADCGHDVSAFAAAI